MNHVLTIDFILALFYLKEILGLSGSFLSTFSGQQIYAWTAGDSTSGGLDTVRCRYADFVFARHQIVCISVRSYAHLLRDAKVLVLRTFVGE